MFKKITFSILFISILATGYSQTSVNDYKYVIVPTSFDFLKGADTYQLNSITKHALNKYGFEAFLEDEVFPDDLLRNNCLALKANVIKVKGIMKTKLYVELKNCKKEIIYTTFEGSSREKSHKVAYNLALRAAVKSFQSLNYTYKPNQKVVAIGDNNEDEKTQDEIAQLKEEIKTLKKEKATVKKTPISKKDVIKVSDTSILNAKTTENGFSLLNFNSEIVYTIKKTGLNNVFIVEGKQAILYQLDAHWVLEHYQENILKKELLNIKF